MPQQNARTKPSARPTLRRGADFFAAGLIGADQQDAIDRVATRYAVAVTPTLVDLIDPTDPSDPIARQFIPDLRELQTAPSEISDPIGDYSHSPVKGVVHRYPDRVLLTPLLHCPVYCRFCFRRERVGGDEKILSDDDLDRALDYIAAHDEIWEVVLTGGDPLMLPPARLGALLRRLEEIPHLQIIRLHSRIPIADPARIDPAMIAALTLSRAAVWLAVHSNHPREFSPAAIAACRAMAEAGIPLLGQTVLLQGVNDESAILEALFRQMVANRIKPYYLHQLDLAPGTEHFRVSIERGQELMRHLRGRISGLCLPTYVLDIPGGQGKIPIGPTYLSEDQATDWQGNSHSYRDPASP
jgi:lysine 2,3-aminomutase